VQPCCFMVRRRTSIADGAHKSAVDLTWY